MQGGEPLLADRTPISGYGPGLFRLGGIEHRGSLVILPGGVFAWDVSAFDDLTAESLAPLVSAAAGLPFILLGTGATQLFPAPGIREAFAAPGIGLEVMDTGAACRTYNVLLGEGRIFAAALIALPGQAEAETAR
jgi:uncharacterized protein